MKISIYLTNYNPTKKKINIAYINNAKQIFFILKLPIKKIIPITTDKSKRRIREVINKSDPNSKLLFNNKSPLKKV